MRACVVDACSVALLAVLVYFCALDKKNKNDCRQNGRPAAPLELRGQRVLHVCSAQASRVLALWHCRANLARGC